MAVRQRAFQQATAVVIGRTVAEEYLIVELHGGALGGEPREFGAAEAGFGVAVRQVLCFVWQR